MGPILLYSTHILDEISGDSYPTISPRQGTYLIGLVNLLCSITGVFASKYFSRRFLLIFGHLFMGLSHVAVGFFAYFEMPTSVLVSMLFFIFFFQNSSGNVTWPYCTEVAVDSVLGVVGFTGYFVLFILDLST